MAMVMVTVMVMVMVGFLVFSTSKKGDVWSRLCLWLLFGSFYILLPRPKEGEQAWLLLLLWAMVMVPVLLQVACVILSHGGRRHGVQKGIHDHAWPLSYFSIASS